MSTSIPRPHSDGKKRYKWHRYWKVNVQARTASHISGMVYDFTPGSQDGLSPPLGAVCLSRSWSGALRGGMPSAGKLSQQTVARLCREACTLFDAAARFACQDCSIDTCGGDHYYMVADPVWDEAHPSYDGMLCLDCLTQRLGRPLIGANFPDLPINHRNRRVLSLWAAGAPVPA